MENLTKKVITQAVDVDNTGFVLCINDGGTYSDYGSSGLQQLKGIILDHIDNGGDVKDCTLGLYKELQDVEIRISRSVEATIEDAKYDETEQKFKIIDRGGHTIVDGIDRYEVRKKLESLLEELPVNEEIEERYQVCCVVDYTSDVSFDVSLEVDIYIPGQDVEVLVEEVPVPSEPIQQLQLPYMEMPTDMLLSTFSHIKRILIQRGIKVKVDIESN